ncbi:MAG: RES family NAD+ phosphorylase [Actinomycetota bacterium]|nr:RES family NAD+ phosphorylase [Actinomycetota bacterium]
MRYRRLPVEAWFFASGGGRFDLSKPHGSCYLATELETAVRERIGVVMTRSSMLPESQMHAMEAVALHAPETVTLANTGDKAAADWGAIRELGAGAVGSYEKSARWATAFKAAGFGGVLYESRFSSVTRATAIALFGTAGTKPWPEGERLTGQEAFEQTGLLRFVAAIPTSRSVSVINPPPRRQA